MGSKREVLLLHYFIYVLRYISEESVEGMKTGVREDCYNVLISYFGTT